jgi:hypothetical protein
MTNRRDHYRIYYPKTERPRFVLGSSICEVVECSEAGFRFRTPHWLPALGAHVHGRLRLRHGADVRVEGRVARADGSTVTVQLSEQPIPFSAVLREQLYLRRAFLHAE